ncbi:MAG: hypothetical protein C0501_00075 [Isosphaera sp.]|nr:hypothetical protein [Isosphaera sp.]
MAAAGDERSRLVRVQGPPLPVVALASEAAPTAGVSELVRVRGPALPVVALTSVSVASVHLELTVALRPDTAAAAVAAVFGKLTDLVAVLNAYEADLGGAGFWVDESRSGARPGPAVGLVLVPNEPAGAEGRLRRVADLLVKTAGGYAGVAKVAAKVVSAAAPDKPIYQVAA